MYAQDNNLIDLDLEATWFIVTAHLWTTRWALWLIKTEKWAK